jgi:hypothetical protein
MADASATVPATPAAAEAAVPAAASPLQGFSLADFSGSVPTVLQQLVKLLGALAAPDELIDRLQAAVNLVAAGRVQLQAEQQEMFETQYMMLQLWVKRQRVDKVAGAVAVLLGVLGV